MQAEINIPYAVADFATLRGRGYYYVDKTRHIPLLERYNAPVFLRPRRFGKSLLVSTLAYYYDINAADRFDTLFGGTYIGEHPTGERNKYMVLRFNFSQLVMADNMEGLEQNFNRLASSPIRGFVRGEARYTRFFEGFHFTNDSDASNSLSEILDWVRDNNCPPLYILIDEYDNFTNQLLTTYQDPLYENVTTGDSFLRTFFKTIKSGIDGGTIRCCFCTGVLPVTMDDLTSGYNIAQILTLEPDFVEMLGFNHEETATYLRYVIDKYGERKGNFDELWELIVSNYDGYRFLPDAPLLFNSTILSYFFFKYAVSHGGIPDEMIDENLRTDIGWIRRLTVTQDNAREMLDTLLVDNELPYSASDLRSKFNKRKFFDKRFYPVSLYYLGMTTLESAYRMRLPNLTMRSIYMDYYNEMNHIEARFNAISPAFEAFTQSGGKLEDTVMSFFREYLGQFPAQAFDKINENFVRCAFYALCYTHLSPYYTFAMEQNLPSGRADLVMTGIPGTPYYADCRVLKFKYFKAKEAARIKALATPDAEDAAQARAYADDILRQFPHYKMRTYVVYIAAGKACRVWETTPARLG
ncbi:MAG: ATP-binding protein [Mediterranea sp.]|jgi:hypothetical protein|nr:ATP-binding protein [Mediterranea sp.]